MFQTEVLKMDFIAYKYVLISIKYILPYKIIIMIIIITILDLPTLSLFPASNDGLSAIRVHTNCIH